MKDEEYQLHAVLMVIVESFRISTQVQGISHLLLLETMILKRQIFA